MDFFKSKEIEEYFLGLVISDGHMSRTSRNRGKITIELNNLDSDILEKLQQNILVNSFISERKRRTNFSKCYKSKILNIHNFEFRKYINFLGIPYGNKENVNLPVDLIYSSHFWRGVIDGDGSIGITKKNEPFVSFTSKSESMAKGFAYIIDKECNQEKILNRNKRDCIFNITIKNENAQAIIKFLNYENSFISLNRKYKKAKDVLNWKRSSNVIKRNFALKKWTKEDDQFILTHCVQDSIYNLKRSEKSIRSRLWRLS